MLYAILCYDSEEVVSSWSKEHDEKVISKLIAVQEGWAKEGRLGPVARLMNTSTASTLRKGKEAVVLDGPFAETKEQLLGFYMIDCVSLDEALDTAKELGRANPGGSYEIRPVGVFHPGTAGS